MGYSIMKILISGCLSFIMVTSSIDSHGMFSNLRTESKIEVNNIESNTETATETIIKEKGIDSVPPQETVEETECTEETVQTVDKIEEEAVIEEEVKQSEVVETTKTTETTEIIESYTTTEQPTEQLEATGDKVSIGTYKLTAYCACSKCCGKWAGGNTSSGTVPTQGRTVACNTLPAGTKVNINGHDYIVEDTGNMKGNVIDIFFNSHQEALNFGVQYAEVFVYKD